MLFTLWLVYKCLIIKSNLLFVSSRPQNSNLRIRNAEKNILYQNKIGINVKSSIPTSLLVFWLYGVWGGVPIGTPPPLYLCACLAFWDYFHSIPYLHIVGPQLQNDRTLTVKFWNGKSNLLKHGRQCCCRESSAMKFIIGNFFLKPVKFDWKQPSN